MRNLVLGLALVAAVASLGACSDPKTAHRVLQQQGYTQINLTGYSLFGCGKDDTFATGFTAMSPGNHPVRGVVCSDWFKGATIRLF